MAPNSNGNGNEQNYFSLRKYYRSLGTKEVKVSMGVCVGVVASSRRLRFAYASTGFEKALRLFY